MKLAALVLAVLTLAPAVLAAPATRSEAYVGPGLGLVSVVAACQEERNVGAVCFELDGTERTARVQVQDALVFMPAARWVALDAGMDVLGQGDACWGDAVIPEGAAYFAVTFTSRVTPILECRDQAYAGTVHVTFG